MKKGFTLIELLAVIVVLAVIALIAVPRIMDAIDESRYGALRQNNEVAIKSAQNYLVKNDHLLPKVIGEVVEINLQTLIEEGELSFLKNPYGNDDCNGYILVTKDDNDFIYEAHIRCDEEITSREEDGLLAYYSFNDFQEPTINLANTESLRTLNFHSGGASGNGSSPAPEKGEGWYKFHVDSIGTNFRIARFPYLNKPEGETRTYSIEFDFGDTEGYYWRLDGTSGGSGNITETDNFWSSTRTASADWQQAIFLCNQDLNTSNRNDVIYYRYYQVEKKPYSTPYTDDERESYLTDYSGNNNSVLINVLETPRWVTRGRGTSSIYNFNGEQRIFTDLTFEGTNNYSVSVWLNLADNHPGDLLHRPLGTNDWGIGRFGIVVFRDNSLRANTYFGAGYDYWQNSNIDLSNREWVHVALTMNRNGDQVLYVDGKEVQRRDISSASHIPWNEDNIVISQGSSTGTSYRRFIGDIDNVMIFDRELSKLDVKNIYLSSSF